MQRTSNQYLSAYSVSGICESSSSASSFSSNSAQHSLNPFKIASQEPCSCGDMEPPPKYSGRGIAFIMLGALFGSLMYLLVKLLADDNPFTLIFYRGLAQVVVSALAIYYQGSHPLGPPGEVRTLLLLRAVFGAMAVCAWFFGAQVLPLPDAVTLHFTSPPFTALFACWFLGERWMPLDMIGAVVCLAGVALIAHPTFLFPHTKQQEQAETDPSMSMQALAVVVCTIGAAVAGLAYVCVRAIGDRASAVVMVFYYGAVSLPVAALGSILFEGTWDVFFISGPRDCILILLIGLLGVATQWLVNLGLQNETAATASLVTSTQIVWTWIFEILFLHEALDHWSVLGSGLILGYVLVVAATKLNCVDREERTGSKEAALLSDEESIRDRPNTLPVS